MQGIVAGIGFLGGGAILRREDDHSVHGLTTAASIWIVAAIGIAAGLGLWQWAGVAAVIVLLLLTVGRFVDDVLYRLLQRRR